MSRIAILTIFAFVSFAFSSVVFVQNWGYNKTYNKYDIVIYSGKAYLAAQNVAANVAPSQNNSVWKVISRYSNPNGFRYDVSYVAGDAVKCNNEMFVAKQWVNNTAPDKNNLSGAWIFVKNYSPITGPLAKLPPHPGEAGKKTLLGIDSEGHGVRDDILIAVTKLIPDDPHKRAGILFEFAMVQELWKAVLENPNKPFEFYYPYFMGGDAGSHYRIETGAYEKLSIEKTMAMRYNTKARFLMSEKIYSIANGHGFRQYDDYPELKEKYDKMFQEFYNREQERQK
jgi:hypothetical protein